jgi:hypothetical protein
VPQPGTNSNDAAAPGGPGAPKYPLRIPLRLLGTDFGAGVYLYFRFLVFLGVVFLLMALCAAPWVAALQEADYFYWPLGPRVTEYTSPRTLFTRGQRSYIDGLSLGAVLEVPTLSNELNARMRVQVQLQGQKIVRISKEVSRT